MNIKAIEKTTVHRICSGQVVLNLATAVKELVENSIDAGATVVDIRLKDYGSELVEVSDNGHGVHPDNFQGLTLKHHTSKLRDFTDLIGVETYGFRGEALSSLCALSDVSVLTRHNSLDCGTELIFDHNGYILEQKQCARQIGTTVSLANLFSTLPVRQKEFLKNIKREFNKMIHLLNAYCLVSTGIKITCVGQTQKGSKTVFVATHGCKHIKENISCVFGSKQLTNLLEIKQCLPNNETLDELKLTTEDCNTFNLDGYITSCAHGVGRNTNDRQFFYINSRPCEPSKIMKTVNEIYHQFNVHQFPFVFLNIRVAKESVDVNVTPDKRQIFLNHEKLLIAIIKESLLNTFKNIASTFEMNNVSIKSQQTKPAEDNFSIKKPNISMFSQWRSSLDKRKIEETITATETKKFKSTKDNSYQSSKQSTLNCFKIDKLTNPTTSSQFNDTRLDTEVEEPIEDASLLNLENSRTKTYSQNNLAENLQNQEINIDENPSVVIASPSFDDSVNKDNCEPIIDEGISSQNVDNEVDSLTEKTEIQESQESGVEYDEIIEEETKRPPVYDTFIQRNKKTITIPYNFVNIKTVFNKRVNNINLKQQNMNNVPILKFRAAIDPTKNDLAEQELNKEITKDMFEKMEIIGQFNLGFIITRLDSDLFIIDQHATDEKYNFETLQKNTVISQQKLVVPQQLELTAANKNILIDNIEVFRKNGFDFNIDENGPPMRSVSLTAIPMSKNWIFGKEDVDELIFMLEDSPHTDCRPSRVRSMFASRACRKSVMIGSALNVFEMKKLVKHMGEIEQPWNCPHGRPTMRHLINLDLLDS